MADYQTDEEIKKISRLFTAAASWWSRCCSKSNFVAAERPVRSD